MEDFKIAAGSMGIDLSPGQITQFEIYYQSLGDWNERVNLTSITERAEVFTKHFLDSLSCLIALPKLPKHVVDVGAGAGFPGLALKIAQPHIQLTLVESTGKKVKFLRFMVEELALENMTVLHNRAEEVGRLPAHRGRYDLALARAVAGLPVLAEYMLPLLKKGGLMLAQKGRDPGDEVRAAANALGILGGVHRRTLSVAVPNLKAERHLVLVKKMKETPKQYPRRAGTPAKKPIR
ncbi:MAG TPA: 16S rRNA (guanine(527)-N(7))-methyltransferase RsmG [Chloroflexi bacterium]|nr:16S rRNA (guanine(527)-N(7))-methyltransferase RsmG [Chloroflexota bacterium]